MRRSFVALVALACLVVGALVTLGVQRVGDERRESRAVLDLDAGTVARADHATRGTYTIYLTQACVDGEGTARITSVDAEKTSHVRIVGFAVGAPGSVWGDNARLPLKKFVDGRGHGYQGRYPTVVPSACKSSDPYSRRPIAVSVAYDGRGRTGVLLGARISYTVNGRTETARTPNGYLLCTGRETKAGDRRLAADLGLDDDEVFCADFP